MVNIRWPGSVIQDLFLCLCAVLSSGLMKALQRAKLAHTLVWLTLEEAFFYMLVLVLPGIVSLFGGFLYNVKEKKKKGSHLSDH